MNGMSASTGKALSGKAHCKQSIIDILTTRKGTRVMRRSYGSDLPALVDSPMNEEGISDIIAATAGALKEWEPRISVKKVEVYSAEVGKIMLSITGTYLPDGSSITIEGIEIT